jgi:hypothetical protein
MSDEGYSELRNFIWKFCRIYLPHRSSLIARHL